MSKRWLVILLSVGAFLIIFATVGVFAWTIFFAHPKIEAKTALAETKTLDEEVTASGVITPEAKVNVVSKLTGAITQVLAAVGDTVQAGQVICTLDAAEYDLKVKQAQASLDSAKANRDKVVNALNQSTPTAPGGGQYTQEDKRAADAQVAQAQAALDLAKAELDATNIRSPVNGTIVELAAVVGEIASSQKPVAVVVDPAQMYMEAKVDETDIARVKVGQKAKITLDSYPEKTLKGEVVEISMSSTSTKAGGTAYSVKVRIVLQEGLTLRSGMSGDATIIVKKHVGVIAVPIEAVIEKEDGAYVFVVKNSLVKKRKVKLGISTQDYYEVKSGLEDGERVAVEKIDTLVGGEKIK